MAIHLRIRDTQRARNQLAKWVKKYRKFLLGRGQTDEQYREDGTHPVLDQIKDVRSREHTKMAYDLILENVGKRLRQRGFFTGRVKYPEGIPLSLATYAGFRMMHGMSKEARHLLAKAVWTYRKNEMPLAKDVFVLFVWANTRRRFALALQGSETYTNYEFFMVASQMVRDLQNKKSEAGHKSLLRQFIEMEPQEVRDRLAHEIRCQRQRTAEENEKVQQELKERKENAV